MGFSDKDLNSHRDKAHFFNFVHLIENFILHKFLKRKGMFSDVTNRAEGLNEMRSRGTSENYPR